MDELQLKVSRHRVALIIQAIDRDLQINRVGPDAEELTNLNQWLRYRLARAALRATQPRTD